jgi:GNAT superfamily N-acetyltransferase
MPRLDDPTAIQAILERDRPWAVYALGDLGPGFAEHSDWFALEDEPPALLLLYRRFDPPVLFALGAPERLASLIDEVDLPVVSLHLRPEALAALAPGYRLAETRAMWRMLVEPATVRPAPVADVSPLDLSDLDAILGLFADGHRRGEGPAFFDPSMVGHGIFRGVWEGDDLVAVAGTHMTEPSFSVCAIGNVYTRHDRRRQGLAARVTSAVVTEAFRRNLQTVVLNVDQRNLAAARVYDRLSFVRYCDFVEGIAHRVRGSSS